MKQCSHLREIYLSYRPKKAFSAKIGSSSDAESIAREIFRLNRIQISFREVFVIILVNYQHEVIGYYKLSEGGLHGTVADLRIAFAAALKSLATGMILIHNHPSGNLIPSEQDIRLTQKFRQAGEIMEIKILDHLILTVTDYYSFEDNGV